jgi:hypothetical protein
MNKYIIIGALLFLIVFLLFYFNPFTIKKKSTSNNHKVDCVVSDWGNCDSKTGTETRSIITPESNQGQPCPELVRNCPGQGNSRIIDYSTLIFKQGDVIKSDLYDISNYNMILTLNLPDNQDGVLSITDSNTFSFTLDPINKITLQKGTVSYNPGDKLVVSYNNLVINTSLIDKNSTVYYNYNTTISSTQPQKISLEINCKSGSSNYQFTNIKFYSTGVIPKTDCVVSDWIESPCDSKTGFITKTRSIITPPLNQGKECPTDLIQPPIPCNVDCVVSDWGACDSLTNTQTRTIIISPLNEGNPCPDLTRNCIRTPSVKEENPVIIDDSSTTTFKTDCVVSEWGDCDPTSGIQTRSIITPASNQGKSCPALTRNCPWTPSVGQGNPTIIDSSTIIFNQDDYVVSNESYNIFQNGVFIQFIIPEITSGHFQLWDNCIMLFIYSNIIIIYNMYGSSQETNYTPGDIFQINYNGSTVTLNLIDSNSVIYWTSSIDYSYFVDGWTNFNSKLEIYNNTQRTITLSDIMFYKKVATQPINRDCQFDWAECDTTTGTQDIYKYTSQLNNGKECPEPRQC